MHVALVIADLFPGGGLQRDCLAIAARLQAQGHKVTLLTSQIRAPVNAPGVTIEELPARGLTHPGRHRALGQAVQQMRQRFDRVVGFNKLPGLDIYFAGDPPYALCKPSKLRSINPRAWAQQRLERACFAGDSTTRIIALTSPQVEQYRAVWGTPIERFRLMSPSLNPLRRQPGLRSDGTRDRLRRELGVAQQEMLWLAVGNYVQTKGLDRTLTALRSAPHTRFFVAGLDAQQPDGRRFLAIARQAGVADRARLLGFREDVPALMAAADVLPHPARVETSGMVLLEAAANGLPVVVSGVCGFASHVAAAKCGQVLPEPFCQEAFEAALHAARDESLRTAWSHAGHAYAAQAGLCSGHAEAARLVTGDLW